MNVFTSLSAVKVTFGTTALREHYLKGNIFWRFDLTCGKELLLCLCNKYLCLFYCHLYKKEDYTQVSILSLILIFQLTVKCCTTIKYDLAQTVVSDHLFNKILISVAELYLQLAYEPSGPSGWSLSRFL